MQELIKELYMTKWKIHLVHARLCMISGGTVILDYKQLTKAAELIEELIIELENQ